MNKITINFMLRFLAKTQCVTLLAGSVLFSCTDDLNNNDVVSTNETPITLSENNRLSANPSDFYELPTTFRATINFKTAFNVDNSFSTDDSSKLQRAIDSLSREGGGRIMIPSGNYSFEGVELRNNIHIEVDRGAVFKPFNTPGRRALRMFLFTSTNANRPLVNTGIYCVSGRYTVDLRDVRPLGRGFRYCNFRNADGFFASNVNIIDDHTRFSAFVFNGETIEFEGNDRAYGPINGVVRNATTINSDFGFGLVQMQLGENILFTNISGNGGSTLRMESHNINLRTLDAVHTFQNVVARNVRCTEGNSAVMLSPHFIDNGVVDIRNVTATHCAFAVRVESGFVTQEEEDDPNTNLTQAGNRGSFNSASTIENVRAIFSPTLAQLRSSFKGFIPCELRSNIVTDSRGDIFGPSVAGATSASNYSINFQEEDIIQFDGFENGQPIILGSRRDSRIPCN